MERVFLPQIDYYTSVKLNGFKDIEKKAPPVCVNFLFKVTFPFFWLVFRAVCSKILHYLTRMVGISIT